MRAGLRFFMWLSILCLAGVFCSIWEHATRGNFIICLLDVGIGFIMIGIFLITYRNLYLD